VVEGRDGTQEVNRESLPSEEYATLRATIHRRANYRCECCGAGLGPFDVDHVIPRSRGGPDHEDNLVTLCRGCHQRKDWPYYKGRLVITPLGDEHFNFEVHYGEDKSSVERIEAIRAI